MDSKQWLLKELNFSDDELYSRRKGDYTNKRRVIIWFYKKYGMSINAIKNRIGLDRSTIAYGIRNISPVLKGLAEEYLHRYITEELHQKPNFTIKRKEPFMVKIKQPDYKHGTVIEKEVIKFPEKPVERLSKWNL